MLPNLIIIGAMRSGTTSLHFYLDQHPEIAMSRTKELNFFVESKVWPCSWHKGADWYARQFDHDAPVRGEASPTYSSFPWFDGAPARMHALIPETKIIYLLRDPIERMISDFRLFENWGVWDFELADAMADLEGNGLAHRSRYFMQLEKYLEYFPAEQIHIATLEDLISNKRQTLREMFRFLGVDENFDTPQFDTVLNEAPVSAPPRTRLGRKLRKIWIIAVMYRVPVSVAEKWLKFGSRSSKKTTSQKNTPRKNTPKAAKPPRPSDEMLQPLREYLREDIDKLRQFCGRDFKEWKL